MIGDRATSGAVDLLDDQDFITGIANLEIMGERGFLDQLPPLDQRFIALDSRGTGHLVVGGCP